MVLARSNFFLGTVRNIVQQYMRTARGCGKMNRVLPGAHVDPLSLVACRRARLQIWLPESTVGATRPGGEKASLVLPDAAALRDWQHDRAVFGQAECAEEFGHIRQRGVDSEELGRVRVSFHQ